MNVDVDKALKDRLEAGEDVAAVLQELGDAVALDAKVFAPKRTGRMAESIHAEVGEDERSAYVRVSWDDEHYYGVFHELGTSKMSAHPFLRPALNMKRTI